MKHFKVTKEILELHLGRSMIIKKIVKNYPNYKEIDQGIASKLAKEVDEYFTTYIYLENSD